MIKENLRTYAPRAQVLLAESPVLVKDPERIRAKRVLVVEDGPTLTHGEMTYGAGVISAQTFGAAEIVDPRPYAVGSIKETYRQYPKIGPVLPAMGYSEKQIRDLEATANAADYDLVIFATPINLTRIVKISKPAVRVRYEYRDAASPTLGDVLKRKVQDLMSGSRHKPG